MVVLASLSMLKKRLPTDTQTQQLLDNAVQGAKRGAALTQSLLAFARRQELKPKSVDLVALITGMKELLQRALGIDINLVFEFAESVPAVLVDANQLELALLNVALNSRDAMPNGGQLRIAITTDTDAVASNSHGNAYVKITVTDDGVGMDAATLTKAAEPFFTTKGPGKGTGLGLSMVHGLAAQSGGVFRIDSTPGEGTVVELLLPEANSPASVDVPADMPRLQHATTAYVRDLRVLVVDDDRLVLSGTTALIDDLGHRAIDTLSGEAALATLASGTSIDVIITDYAMPTMNGLELANAVRTRFPGIPVILMTGYADVPQEQVEPWVVRLTKPCSQDAIASALQVAIDARSAGNRHIRLQ
jgi:CheY-like chemotaxis protein